MFLTLWCPASNLRADTSPADIENMLEAARQQPRIAMSRSSNVFHGRFRTRTVSQESSTGMHMLTNRLDTEGNIERLGGSSWSCSWSGNASYRDGNSYTTALDYKKLYPSIYKAHFTKKFAPGGLARIGRFLPFELSALGYVDGAQVEMELGRTFKWGHLLGTKPNKKNLEWSGQETFAATYLGIETGRRSDLYYDGTLGVSQSFWKGKADELALMWDQHADLTSKLNFYSSSQIDFNVGAGEQKKGTHLVRADVNLNSPLSPYFSLRAGANFYETPDTVAERFLVGDLFSNQFSNSYWRYSGGSSQYLFWNLRLDEDLTYIQSSTTTLNDQKFWRYRITRSGLWFSPRGSLSITVYDLNQIEGNGTGGSATGFFPVFSDRLTLDISVGGRYGAIDVGHEKTWKMQYYSARLNAKLSNRLDVYGGGTQTVHNSFHSTTLESGLVYHW